MDKSTLSNYGWIVIAVLVLSVMIALATPFGKYIENGIRSTTDGLINVNQNALDVVEINSNKNVTKTLKTKINLSYVNGDDLISEIFIEFEEGMTWYDWFDSNYFNVFDENGNITQGVDIYTLYNDTLIISSGSSSGVVRDNADNYYNATSVIDTIEYYVTLSEGIRG